jgi:molybdate transport system substrate-binding protein
MATRTLLVELAAAWDGNATVEATGGVDAARRVRDGEQVDVVVLAGPAMRKLEAEGHLLSGSLSGVARSAVAAAVRQGEPAPDLSDAGAVKRTLLAAGRIGYSTGPSGDHFLMLLEHWGVRVLLGERLVQAPPGTPVGWLLAEGLLDIAVQQRSELMGLPGIAIAGPLPPEIALDTVFTAGIVRTSVRIDRARCFIGFLASPAVSEAKRRHGMEPA